MHGTLFFLFFIKYTFFGSGRFNDQIFDSDIAMYTSTLKYEHEYELRYIMTEQSTLRLGKTKRGTLCSVLLQKKVAAPQKRATSGNEAHRALLPNVEIFCRSTSGFL